MKSLGEKIIFFQNKDSENKKEMENLILEMEKQKKDEFSSGNMNKVITNFDDMEIQQKRNYDGIFSKNAKFILISIIIGLSITFFQFFAIPYLFKSNFQYFWNNEFFHTISTPNDITISAQKDNTTSAQNNATHGILILFFEKKNINS